MKSVGDLNPGDFGIVQGFSGNLRLQSRLVEMGILPGVEIRMVKKAPLNGPVELKVRDYYVFIRRQDACSILVKFL